VKYLLAKIFPPEFHRTARCRPDLPTPTYKRIPLTVPVTAVLNLTPTSLARDDLMTWGRSDDLTRPAVKSAAGGVVVETGVG
jgi:hypothetical protein